MARPGAVMPDGTELGRAKLRGVESDGMILAEDELGIGTLHAGIMVLDEDGLLPGTPLADLQGTLLAFARAVYGDEREVRLRPHFFPFTEPSVELDISCFNCRQGFLPDGSRCPLCKGEGWVEILGAGMVDPNVFGYVREHGYDPERVQGFAFGMGIERLAFLRHGIPDLRMFFENDLRLLEQFG